MSALKTALEMASLGYKVFPLVPKGKTPLLRDNWREIASNDESVITGWAFQHGDINFGLPMGDNNLVALDFDSAMALDWATSQLRLPGGCRVVTPSGGEHWVYSTHEADIQTNHGKLYPGVDVRGQGGYIVLAGSYTVVTNSDGSVKYEGEYDGDMSYIPPLPDVVLELLPRVQKYSSKKPAKTVKVESATTGEQVMLEWVQRTLGELPRPWFEGAEWDNTVFNMSCVLWRMVNSPEYAITESQALELLLSHAPVDDVWGDQDNLAKWESARKQTVGQYADTPHDVPLLLSREEYQGLVARLGQVAPELHRLHLGGKDSREIRSYIQGLHRNGFTAEQIRTLVFHCAPNNVDPAKKRSWWRTIVEITNPITVGSVVVEPAKLDNPVVPVRRKGRAVLLSEYERSVAENAPGNFVEEYVKLAKALYVEPNVPLHYLAGWQALSVTLGGDARLANRKRLGLNLWGLHIAETASGKGDVKDLFKNTVKAALGGEGYKQIFLGSDATEQSLNRKLLEKGSGAAFLLMDEGHKVIRKMNDPKSSVDQSYQGYLTDIYDGEVRTILRQGQDRNLEGKEATVAFSMLMLGTWEGYTQAFSSEQIADGFIGRFLVAVGNERNITRESLSANPIDPSYVELTGGDPRIVQLGRSIQTQLQQFSSVGSFGGGAKKRFTAVTIPAEVDERYVEARLAVLDFYRGHASEKDLQGISLRMTENALKCAALVALYNGRTSMVVEDLLIALRSLEYWAADLLLLIENITPEWRRVALRVQDYIGKASRAPSRQDLLRRFSGVTTRAVDEALDRLMTEGVVVADVDGKNVTRYRCV